MKCSSPSCSSGTGTPSEFNDADLLLRGIDSFGETDDDMVIDSSAQSCKEELAIISYFLNNEDKDEFTSQPFTFRVNHKSNKIVTSQSLDNLNVVSLMSSLEITSVKHGKESHKREFETNESIQYKRRKGGLPDASYVRSIDKVIKLCNDDSIEVKTSALTVICQLCQSKYRLIPENSVLTIFFTLFSLITDLPDSRLETLGALEDIFITYHDLLKSYEPLMTEVKDMIYSTSTTSDVALAKKFLAAYKEWLLPLISSATLAQADVLLYKCLPKTSSLRPSQDSSLTSLLQCLFQFARDSDHEVKQAAVSILCDICEHHSERLQKFEGMIVYVMSNFLMISNDKALKISPQVNVTAALYHLHASLEGLERFKSFDKLFGCFYVKKIQAIDFLKLNNELEFATKGLSLMSSRDFSYRQ